jgi:hypothetical protein
MKVAQRFARISALTTLLILLVALSACNNPPADTVSSAPEQKAEPADMTDAKRLSDGASKLMQAMSKPTEAFHFSFRGQVNLAEDKTQPPQVGPVALQAEVSPEQINLTETRGAVTKTARAKKGEETNWSVANVTTLRTMTNPNFVIALGATVSPPPTTDRVGNAFADKYTFDTSAPDPRQKLGLEAARAVLPAIKDCKGTAWIAEQSGLLIKFNIDADYLDRYNHAWKEHYEGDVTPK